MSHSILRSSPACVGLSASHRLCQLSNSGSPGHSCTANTAASRGHSCYHTAKTAASRGHNYNQAAATQQPQEATAVTKLPQHSSLHRLQLLSCYHTATTQLPQEATAVTTLPQHISASRGQPGQCAETTSVIPTPARYPVTFQCESRESEDGPVLGWGRDVSRAVTRHWRAE